MYRISPFTYLVSGVIATGLANNEVVCTAVEYLHFDPPTGKTCESYLATYIAEAGGYLTNGNATSDCSYCALSETNEFLESVYAFYDTRWRNFGFMFAYIIFNIFGAIFLYWLARVPKKGKPKNE